MDITPIIKNRISGIMNFEQDEHEKDVLNVLEFLVTGSKDEFCNYKLISEEKITCAVFNEYYSSLETIKDSSLILRAALFLHDAGKRKPGFHPENSFRIAEKILTTDILPLEYIETILWLIRYHDVMGNIYTGERKAGFLRDIMRGLCDEEREKRLTLLRAVTLCDLSGTEGGAYLTNEKAEFYRELSGPQNIKQKDAKLFGYRIKRWSGSVNGKDDPAGEKYILDKIACSQNKETIKKAFGEKITHIINGFYLFTGLSKEELAELMEEIACAFLKIQPGQEITLEFTKPYRIGKADSEEMLRKFKKKLANNEISKFINVSGNRIIVDNKNI